MAGKRGPYRKRRGFYGKALAADESALREPQDERTFNVDVRELKRRLIEAMRKQPGEVHLLLQVSKTLLRAEAMEGRRSRVEE